MAEAHDPPSPHDAPPPDIMNDPKFATNTEGEEDGTGDADTCRICRGEGSDSEPLFHPCKCSGSIKHVHQDCLMEWLSHSQKKHCELCKTPFRFTKLYSPNMPQSLPFDVLVRHVIVHIAKNLATWLRFCLVIVVWLAFLPYVIRQVWRLLFWFSDGGWPPNHVRIDPVRNSTTIQALEMAREIQLVGLIENGTSPVTPFHAAQTTPARIGTLVNKLAEFLMPISQTLNISGSDPLAAGLFKSLYYGFGIQSIVIPDDSVINSTTSDHLINIPPLSPNQSLLSEVSFLRNLTRNSYINQLIITIAEGYIITFLVVVCFILVFLIREWVVQQQPGINMGAGFNAEFAREQQPAPEPRPRRAEVRRIAEPRRNVEPRRNAWEENRNQLVQQRNPPVRELQEGPMARPRRRNVHFGEADDIIPRAALREPNETQPGPSHGDIGATGLRRPSPSREASARAAEINRTPTETDEPRMTEDFISIWKRANGNSREILRIIEQENKSEQMRYWVKAMKDLPVGSESDRSNESSESWVDIQKQNEQPLAKGAAENMEMLDAEAISGEHSPSQDKGKSKMRDFEEEIKNPAMTGNESFNLHVPAISEQPWKEFSAQSDLDPFAPSTSRPRAASDGPQRSQNISPLANNNWSFSNLPYEHADDVFMNKLHRRKAGEPNTRDTKTASERADTAPAASDAQGQLQNSESSSPQIPGFTNGEPYTFKGQPPLLSEVEITQIEQGPIEIHGQDGIVRTYQNIEEVFEANPVEPDSDSDSEGGVEEPEANPFHPDVPLPEPREPVVAPPPVPRGFFGNVADFLWGGVDDERQDEQGANDERIVQDLAAEAPFVPVANHDLFEQAAPEQDQEVVEAAIAAGIDPNDQDAIDDAEDFEGIMELVGMRGPVFSLVQNALFSAFLLALTVAFGVWIPYNIGRTAILLLANPGPAFKLPLRLVFGCAAFLQDLTLSIIGILSYCLIAAVSLPVHLWTYYFTDIVLEDPTFRGVALGPAALQVSQDALERIVEGTASGFANITDSEIFAFSAASHEALISIQSLITNALAGLGAAVIYLFTGDGTITFGGISSFVIDWLRYGWYLLLSVPALLIKPDTWVISLGVAERATPLDLGLSVWDGWARFWAILAGYTALCILGGLYVRKGSMFSTSLIGREWEATILDLLNQAGGVMKVILIISIEMLVFPLYCGLLLDAALLPLFDSATIMSRILFTIESPLTSMFVHWFVGTCYMFHFALFVSMCRKIMRKGVLCKFISESLSCFDNVLTILDFIRDPDDPTFHPVRDVLERNVATQLRKILFSALVYGALVVICLGGVVWGLAFAFKNVLPIHWSSNEPVLEFPIDLLFYNFLMPLAVKFFKPSDGLQAMYSWWFRQCARMLRLTWFMFDERKLDEEGYHVRRTWGDIFRGFRGDPTKVIKTDDKKAPFNEDPDLKAYFCRDGKYVRAPASDQVRIPKGGKIFLQVDESNNRIDGKWDRPDGTHGRTSELYKQVYIPPHFQFRICLFILFIWLFAAITGVSITIVPLVFGRHIFAKIIPPHVRKNDVYAFSIGIYILGSALYAILHVRQFIAYLRDSLAVNAETPHNVVRRVTAIASRVARIGWTYSAFLFVLPTLFAFVIEFYFIVPLHTYFSTEERHVVHFVQSWTLGLLYVKLTTRLILWHEESRPAQSLRAITRNGYLDPDAKLATRSFILPAVLVLSFALTCPWGLAKIATMTILKNNPETHFLTYRYAYPMCLALCCIGVALWRLLGMLKEWRTMIKDEVYLIGERLHNFGDRKVVSPTVTSGVSAVRRLET
ncbi:hypothetical protein G7Y89_g6059 [Cudoniella acicularis]|uniref:RING-type E3 ubiquitin transferase n=1 Tax=Cudoniella acicularis TaxID=354080 RepID=A0A8H4RMN5_9HELO|nr:hypothetical protein G7Y89_g6059 [Cudoniella acicularis]